MIQLNYIKRRFYEMKKIIGLFLVGMLALSYGVSASATTFFNQLEEPKNAVEGDWWTRDVGDGEDTYKYEKNEWEPLFGESARRKAAQKKYELEIYEPNKKQREADIELALKDADAFKDTPEKDVEYITLILTTGIVTVRVPYRELDLGKVVSIFYINDDMPKFLDPIPGSSSSSSSSSSTSDSSSTTTTSTTTDESSTSSTTTDESSTSSSSSSTSISSSSTVSSSSSSTSSSSGGNMIISSSTSSTSSNLNDPSSSVSSTSSSSQAVVMNVATPASTPRVTSNQVTPSVVKSVPSSTSSASVETTSRSNLPKTGDEVNKLAIVLGLIPLTGALLIFKKEFLK